MSLTQIVVLAIFHGVSLVLPVGAASHMHILQALTAWPNPSPQLLLALNFGGFVATLAYFGGDAWDMGVGVVRAAKGKRNPEARLAVQFFVASVLALGIGFAFDRYVLTEAWNSLKIVAWCTLGFGLLLFALDQTSMTVKRVEHAGMGDTIFVAIGQVVSLVPGVSRTGIAMTFARFLGYERIEAAKFSYLLSLPVLFALIGRGVYDLIDVHALTFGRLEIVASVIAFFTTLPMLAIMMGFLQRRTFTVIVIYRLLVGGLLAMLAYDVIAF